MATPGPAGGVGEPLGHVARALLVAHEDVADRRVDDRVVHREDGAAGQAEDDLHALHLEGLDQGLATVDLRHVRSLGSPKSAENDDDLPAGRSLSARASVRRRALGDYYEDRGGCGTSGAAWCHRCPPRVATRRASRCVSGFGDGAALGACGRAWRTWPARPTCSGVAGSFQSARRRASSSAGDVEVDRAARSTSITMRSPSRTNAIGPPSTASGATWPTQKPWVPPENRPSVTSAAVAATARALHRAGDGEHLAHARAALRSLVADHDDVAGLDASRPGSRPSRRPRRRTRGRCPRTGRSRFRRPSRPHPSARASPRSTAMPPPAVERSVEPGTTSPSGAGGSSVGEVLGHGLAGDGEAVAVQQSRLEQVTQHDRHAADPVEVDHVVAAVRLHVRDVRHTRRHLVEVVELELDACLVGDRRADAAPRSSSRRAP